ncbi:unnamed protein product [Pleuronectes platessa]|uniref:Uncharacterized protein n=1 Tax=Pleuronectes platessa TaxID=8262 RepID=A0A9N7VU63_PLEPL|nr:unnamed protein product [Pleuronectes platessa]
MNKDPNVFPLPCVQDTGEREAAEATTPPPLLQISSEGGLLRLAGAKNGVLPTERTLLKGYLLLALPFIISQEQAEPPHWPDLPATARQPSGVLMASPVPFRML